MTRYTALRPFQNDPVHIRFVRKFKILFCWLGVHSFGHWMDEYGMPPIDSWERPVLNQIRVCVDCGYTEVYPK